VIPALTPDGIGGIFVGEMTAETVSALVGAGVGTVLSGGAGALAAGGVMVVGNTIDGAVQAGEARCLIARVELATDTAKIVTFSGLFGLSAVSVNNGASVYLFPGESTQARLDIINYVLNPNVETISMEQVINDLGSVFEFYNGLDRSVRRDIARALDP
jgi:hypothetical protein